MFLEENLGCQRYGVFLKKKNLKRKLLKIPHKIDNELILNYNESISSITFRGDAKFSFHTQKKKKKKNWHTFVAN